VEGRDMALRINDGNDITRVSFPVTPNGTAWRISNVPISLSQGLNVIELSSLSKAGSPYIDELIFGSTGISPAGCTTGGLITIQAENACIADGVLNETIHEGYRGEGYVNTANFEGASINWVINSTSKETINLRIRYSHNTASGRDMELKINETVQNPAVSFPATGKIWKTTTIPVSLEKGRNEIQLASLTAAGSPYMDQLTFSSTNVSSASCDLPPSPVAYSSIGPNPTGHTFDLIANESIHSFTVIGADGAVWFNGGNVEEGARYTFGEALKSGLYIVDITYTGGRRERKKISKVF